MAAGAGDARKASLGVEEEGRAAPVEPAPEPPGPSTATIACSAFSYDE
jgi:hypothetical protein